MTLTLFKNSIVFIENNENFLNQAQIVKGLKFI